LTAFPFVELVLIEDNVIASSSFLRIHISSPALTQPRPLHVLHALGTKNEPMYAISKPVAFGIGGNGVASGWSFVCFFFSGGVTFRFLSGGGELDCTEEVEDARRGGGEDTTMDELEHPF
jgi:hypothetical protein